LLNIATYNNTKKHKTMKENVYISTEETAKLLNCSLYTIRKLCREKKIVAVKKLKRWYIVKDSIKEFIEKK